MLMVYLGISITRSAALTRAWHDSRDCGSSPQALSSRLSASSVDACSELKPSRTMTWQVVQAQDFSQACSISTPLASSVSQMVSPGLASMTAPSGQSSTWGSTISWGISGCFGLLTRQGGEDAVPELYAGVDRCFRRCFSLAPVAGVTCAQGSEQAQRQRRVEIFIQVDVAVEVVVEARRLHFGYRHARQEGAEHRGDDVLAAERQRSSDRMRLAAVDKAEGGAGEGGGRGRREAGYKRGIDALPARQLHEARRRVGIGADFAHGGEIQHEVAGMACLPRQRDVGFLFQHQFVDEALHRGVYAGRPWPACGGDLVLQIFDQGHEVPHRIDVVLHEHAQVVERLHGRIDRMRFQLDPQGFDEIVVQHEGASLLNQKFPASARPWRGARSGPCGAGRIRWWPHSAPRCRA